MTPTNPIPAELHSRFGIAGIAQIVADEAQSPTVRISTPACSGEMHLHGAQITSWRPAGAQEVIFMSSRARFNEGQAIRGGIPICFPWFRAKSDDPQATAHGFVRTKNWSLESIEHQSGNVIVTMSTESDATTKKWWPGDFRLQHRATFGSNLKLELAVTNAGSSPFQFAEALHTYHLVGDINTARINGLDGATYLDNTASNSEKKQQGDVAISAATDSAYINNTNALELLDPTLHRRVHIAKQNSRTTVVWNPWEAAANKMSDMGPGEWQKMLCAEAANILSDIVELAPAGNHTMIATISVNPL
jgi:glucose-6-phosphate 1-epimerase